MRCSPSAIFYSLTYFLAEACLECTTAFILCRYFLLPIYHLPQNGLYVREKNLADARKNVKIALDMLETVIEKKGDLEEPRQFLNAHYLEFIDLFKDYENKKEIFKKLIKMDSAHKELYEAHVGES
jgi:hypothetical protein